MRILKDIGGAVKSKMTLAMVNRRLVSELVDKIGPEGIIGLRNQSYYTKKIGSMISKGNHQQAIDYANQEAEKVWVQKQKRK